MSMNESELVLLFIVLINLLRLLIPFWIFDFKRDYRALLRFSKSLYIFNRTNFKFNPLIPPTGTAPVQWASIFTDIFFQIFYSAAAASAKSIFLGTLKDIYKNNSVPTLIGLFRAFQRKLYDDTIPSNTKNSIRTIMLRLEPFIDILGDSICGQGFDMAGLLQKEVVLELDGLTIEYQTFIATLIFHWIFTYRLNLAQRGKLKHLLLFDEAKRLFSLNIPLIAQLVSLAREFGQGLILADQMPSCLDHAVMANVYTIIALSLTAPRDMNALAAGMGLNREQHACLNTLPLKTAVVKMAGRYTRPFMFHIPDLVVDKNITIVKLYSLKQNTEDKSDGYFPPPKFPWWDKKLKLQSDLYEYRDEKHRCEYTLWYHRKSQTCQFQVIYY
ncbi:MAG: hypothetical protein PHH77_04370 [Victivallaceae bacterium]|nr:hypothetical protein [Victivallaceae bacterium]